MFFSVVLPRKGHERNAAFERMQGPYAEHQWLWQFFPAAPGTPREFLFRRNDSAGAPRFYVVSKRAPACTGSAWDVMSKPYAPRIGTGWRLRFELRANPVVARRANGTTKRHDVVMDEKARLLKERGLSHWGQWQSDDRPALYDLVRTTCTAWLQARAAKCGFEIDEAKLMVDAYRQHSAKMGHLLFSTVDFSGELIVLDPGAFSGSLFDGIGHARAFGCGLLLVRPAEG